METRSDSHLHEVDIRAQQIADMSAIEFAKVSHSRLQTLLKDLLAHLANMERISDELTRVNNELDNARKEYMDLYHFAPVGYFNLDSKGIVSRVNITARDMLMMDTEKLVNLPFADFIRPKYREPFKLYLDDIAQTHIRTSTAVEMTRGDNTVFDAQIQTVPLWEKSNLVFRLSISDITEQKKLEKELEHLASFPEVNPILIVEIDPAGKLSYVNPSAANRFPDLNNKKLEHPFMIGVKQIGQSLESSGRDSLMREVNTGDACFEQIIMVAHDWIRVYSYDISDRKQTEEALRERDERLRNIFESMDEGFALCEMIYDSTGKAVDFRYLEANPAFASQTGLPVEKVTGRTVRELIPGIEPVWIETYARVVATGNSEKIENDVAELNKYYEVHAWRAGPGRFAVVFHDVTATKKAKR